ncbi:MAG: cytochrome c oxidase assembly protein [Nitriliruptoraceae bacterium]
MTVNWWCSGTGQVWTWRYTPFLGVWIVGATLIATWFGAHRRAGEPVEATTARRWIAGVVILFAISEWPVGQIGAGYLASVGIARYVVFSFVIAPLLVAGIPSWMLQRWLPAETRRAAIVASLTAWPVALLVFNTVMLGTHLPVVIDSLKVTQIGSFAIDFAHLAAAMIWWWPAIRREPEWSPIVEPLRAFYLFATSVLMFVPAAFLTFSPLPLYALYELAPPLWLGFDPVRDQQTAGIMMNVIGGFVLWGIIAVLFLRWARDQQRADEVTRRARNRERLASGPRPPAP